jgi:CRISPR-associated protein Csd1
MILQALKEYYDRKAADPDSNMAPLGWEWKEIPYIIVLNPAGLPISIEDTRQGEGKKKRAKAFLVPQAVKKANSIASNLLWENPEYLLGITLKGKPERVIEQHKAFIDKIDSLNLIDEEGIKAVKSFLAMPEKLTILEAFGEVWKQILEESPNLTFKIAGESKIILESVKIKEAIDLSLRSKSGKESRCLITGQLEEIERLHPSIKGVWGAQTSGANIISFNLDAFGSFGKEQGANSPVGKTATFAYTTAINYLLCRDSTQKMLVGDATAIFWAAKETVFEKQVVDFFGEPPKDDPDRNVRAVEILFSSIKSGAFSAEGYNNKFFVLGLSPNASRISIRFWIVDTVSGMSEKICQYFEDLRIAHGARDRDFPSLFRLLVSIASQGKSENIPPNIAGDTMRAILEGLPYPETLLQAAVRRNRAEQAVSYPRAALIKACINRKTRYKNPKIKEELKMSLDQANTNIGYRLGRLFAALEKIQQEAHPGLNATIRDKFYGAASGTPITVFGNLMRLKNHHLAKLENAGRRINFERLLSEIMDGVEARSGFPAHLCLDDQGRFAIGYYHQMQEFYTKKIDKEQ